MTWLVGGAPGAVAGAEAIELGSLRLPSSRMRLRAESGGVVAAMEGDARGDVRGEETEASADDVLPPLLLREPWLDNVRA